MLLVTSWWDCAKVTPIPPIIGMYFSGETSWGIGLFPLAISPPFGVTSWVNVMSHRPSQLSGGCYSRDHPSIGPHTFDPYHWLNHSWWIWDSTRRSSVATFSIVGESLHRNAKSSHQTHRIIVSPRGDLMKNMENSCGKTWRRKTKPLAFPSEILRTTIQL